MKKQKKWQRLLSSMGLAELACRSRQEAWKRLERWGLNGKNGRADIEGDLCGSDVVRVSERVLARFQEVGLQRFFEGAVDGQVPYLLIKIMPGAQERILAAADAVCEGRFDLLGYRGLSFENLSSSQSEREGEAPEALPLEGATRAPKIDWHLDLVSGRRAPQVHWSRLDPLDFEVVGDSKVIWELNRHQWLIPLGQAYRLTGDERYAERFAAYLNDWMCANPPGIGINWASSLEVALRLISWCWALFLFRESKALSSEFFFQMLEQIRIHATHVERYLSYYFSPNTHLTGEALGLFYAGSVFPDLPQARRWLALGARILIEQSERQILPDGVYFEQSTCYQRYTVEIYLHFLILAERNRMEVPKEVAEQLRRMLDFLLAVRRPDGSIPSIGDADGGWLLPLIRQAPDDFRGIFSTAAALFGRSDYAWAAGGLAPETLWLLGAEGLKTVEAIRPAPPATEPFRIFPDGGYAVMRSGWDANAHHLIFDVGPLGCPVSGGHGHADLLSIQCSVFGEPYLVDPGTYCYTMDRNWRDFFRGTAAHSTVMIDGEGQAVPAGPFRWKRRPQARLRRWLSTDSYDFADAEHDAYGRLPDPVIHRRRVLFVKPRYWILVDDLQGQAEHRVEVRFQFASMKVTVDSSLWARAQGSNGQGLLIRAFSTIPLTADVYEGERAPIQGWTSTNYGQRHPAPVLIYSATACLPLRIVTLLMPLRGALSSIPDVYLSINQGSDPVILFSEDSREVVVIGEQDIVCARVSTYREA